ncbi:MAG: hypothetical protein ABW069_20330, partial [Duganella sp.]
GEVGLQAAATAWLAGRAVDWRSDAGQAYVPRAPLPRYPFEDKPFWLAGLPQAPQPLQPPLPEATAAAPQESDRFAQLFHETFTAPADDWQALIAG